MGKGVREKILLLLDLLVGQCVLFHQCGKIGSLHAHALRRTRDITIAGGEGFGDKGFLKLSETFIQQSFFDLFKIFEGIGHRCLAPGAFHTKIVNDIQQVENSAFGHDDQPFDHVLELSYVTRPPVIYQHVQGIIGKPFYAFSGLFAEMLQKVISELRNVVLPLSKGGKIDGKHV